MKINVKEIKPGDLIAEHGLISKVDHEGNDKFWGKKPNVSYICIHDAYWGNCSSELKHEEHELIEGEERLEWLQKARLDLIDHAKNIQKDLQKVEAAIMTGKKENKMNQPINEVEELKYVVKVNGAIVSPMYATPHLAEDAIKMLKDEHQSIAEVVSVTATGQEILLG
jgi:hypothetical protein